MTRLALVLAAALAVVPPRAAAQSLPTLAGPVNDFAHVIDQDSATLLDQQIRSLQNATGDAVIVATIQTFAPYGSIEDYAVHLFESAGIGQRQKDNGVLILLALNEKRVRIEVGYGLEEYITDGFSGETIRTVMLPEFRKGQYGAGLLAGTTRVIQRIAEARGVTLQNVPTAAEEPEPRGIPTAVIVIIVLVIVVRLLTRATMGPRGFRRGPWSGWHGGIGGFGGGSFGGFGGFGGGGGGFGGFGGGMSGGGGASGGW